MIGLHYETLEGSMAVPYELSSDLLTAKRWAQEWVSWNRQCSFHEWEDESGQIVFMDNLGWRKVTIAP